MRKLLIGVSLCVVLFGCAKQNSSNDVDITINSTTSVAITTTTMATTKMITSTPITTTTMPITTTTVSTTTKPVTTKMTTTTSSKPTTVTTTTNLTEYYAMHGWIYNEDDDTFYPTEEKKEYYRQWYGKTISEVEEESNAYLSMQGPWGESIGLDNFKNVEIGSCFAIVSYKGHKLQFPF